MGKMGGHHGHRGNRGLNTRVTGAAFGLGAVASMRGCLKQAPCCARPDTRRVPRLPVTRGCRADGVGDDANRLDERRAGRIVSAASPEILAGWWRQR